MCYLSQEVKTNRLVACDFQFDVFARVTSYCVKKLRLFCQLFLMRAPKYLHAEFLKILFLVFVNIFVY